MTELKKKSMRKNGGAGKRKSSVRRPSLDNLMGKALCILLVIILTVGAFLAPKMINNLFDAGTLMQITYMDLDMSTYAVAYTSFREKVEAIARAETAGEKLTVLSSEEASEKPEDRELIEITNAEMEELKDSAVMVLWEDWWNELSVENLVSREKNTLYTQPGGTRNGAPGSDMAPVQFWTLTFELTEDQRAQRAEEYRVETGESDDFVMSWPPFVYAAERLVVCLDADFYKIYAIGIEGVSDNIWIEYEMYGYEFPDIFGIDYFADDRGKYTEEMSGYITDVQMNLTEDFLAGWSAYWGVRQEETVYAADRQGEIIGYMTFLNEGNDSAGTDRETGAQSDAETIVVVDSDGNASYAGDKENKYADESIESAYEDWSGGGEILLAVGCCGEFGGEKREVWMQRAGCRTFFEMMQF